MASVSYQQRPKAVVLLSGGLDSCTAAACAAAAGYVCCGLTVSYGQRHRREIDCARQIGQALKLAEHRFIELDLRSLGGSALTSNEIAVPKSATTDSADNAEIPVTYVPARNTILLSLALGWAETLGAFDIFIGVNTVDYSGYPDCRSEFIEAFEKLANTATAAAVQQQGQFHIHAPLMHMSKAEIILRGAELGVKFALTHSCYDPDEQGKACGQCDSCRLRLQGFRQAGLTDPIEYVTNQRSQ